MVSRRDFPTSKELELYALAVVNFVCCHSYTRNATDDCEYYVRTRSPTIPPQWMSESPNSEKVSLTDYFAMSKGYRTILNEDSYQPGSYKYRPRNRNPTRMLDTKGFPPRPVITDSPESDNTWNLGTWVPGNMPHHDAHAQESATSVASSSDSSIFGHPVYSLQASNLD